jgi:hypothetical protein
MLSSCFSTNNAFDTIPDDTNAVESHNKISKRTTPVILKVAMLMTYKVDMSAALEHLAQLKNIPTTYDDLTQEARQKRTKVSNRARSVKRDAFSDADGPPDKRKHIEKDIGNT